MKFKKVEIQAFRAYNEVVDGTFDFNIGNSQSADLVGIYAPNGFGKTSFYDAVEWGVTKNIHRLLKKHKFNIDHAKSERNINGKTKQYILRNRFAKDETPGYVQLFTTNSSKPLKREIPTARAGSVDYKFNDKETINRYFQKVILSQEWIDAFLKEDDAAERYETFIEYFGNRQLDAYRKKIVELLTANDKQITDLKDKLKGVQKELEFTGDQNILKILNDRITTLQAAYPKLKLIENEFTQNDFVNFKNQLTELLLDLKNRATTLNTLQSKQQSALNGDGKVLGLERYEKSQKELTALLNQIKQLDQLISDFQTQAVSNNKLANNQQRQGELNTLLKAVREILEKLPRFFDSVQQQTGIKDQTLTQQTNLENKEKELQVAKNQLKALELQQQSLQQLLTDSDRQLKTAIEKQSGQLNYEADYEKLSKQTSDGLVQIKSITDQITVQQNIVDRLNTVIKDIESDKFPSAEHPSYQAYNVLLSALQIVVNERERLKNEIAALTKSIMERQQLNEDIQRFITLGAEIVDKNQLSICPLCSHDHQEYEILVQRISGNAALSAAIQDLLTQRTTLEQNASANEDALKKEKSNLIDRLTEERKSAEKFLSELRPLLSESQQGQQAAEKAIENLNKRRLEFTSLLGELSYEAYRKKLTDQITETNQQLANLNRQVEVLQALIRETGLNIETIKLTLESLAQQNNVIIANENYRGIYAYFEKNHPGITPNNKTLDEEIAKINLQLATLKSEISSTDRAGKNLITRLESYKLDEVEANRKSLLAQQRDLEQQIKRFELFVRNECSIEQISKIALEAALANLQLLTTGNEHMNNEITLVQQQLENVLPYLRFEKAKLSFDELKVRINFLEHTLQKELEKERKKVGEHLHDEIKAFFFEDLINDLYAKIDPHPEYKKIKFMCDFKEDRPKLNVCVCTEGKDELLIPNLYFSTAQLNILSLSIFLAKALNVQDENNQSVDCIFIDDPIQSMDSINILSTIDLLRSLVVNYQKQIIISTHDENFYNLLQKKIPIGLFKSKYIELETFGKVKADVN